MYLLIYVAQWAFNEHTIAKIPQAVGDIRTSDSV